MKRILAVVICGGVAIGGCSALPAPKSTSAEQAAEVARFRAALDADQVKRAAAVEAEQSAWNVKCTDDFHGTVERRCSAANGKGFSVVYVGGQGPYVQGGLSWHVDKPNVVRVDDGRVHIVSKSKSMLPADALVRDLLRGRIAYATWYDWPHDEPRHSENSLAGFKEAYDRLLKLKASRAPGPQAAYHRE
jgi:hypothetical protein